jgi:hypothetical protein
MSSMWERVLARKPFSSPSQTIQSSHTKYFGCSIHCITYEAPYHPEQCVSSGEKSLKGTVWAVRVNVLMAASMKITAFWNVTPCSLVEVGRRFRRTYCIYHQSVIMKVVHTSETSVYYSAGICSIHDISNSGHTSQFSEAVEATSEWCILNGVQLRLADVTNRVKSTMPLYGSINIIRLTWRFGQRALRWPIRWDAVTECVTSTLTEHVKISKETKAILGETGEIFYSGKSSMWKKPYSKVPHHCLSHYNVVSA